jgi:hypothetical protein
MNFQFQFWRVRFAIEFIPSISIGKRRGVLRKRFGIERRLLQKLRAELRHPKAI